MTFRTISFNALLRATASVYEKDQEEKKAEWERHRTNKRMIRKINRVSRGKYKKRKKFSCFLRRTLDDTTFFLFPWLVLMASIPTRAVERNALRFSIGGQGSVFHNIVSYKGFK